MLEQKAMMYRSLFNKIMVELITRVSYTFLPFFLILLLSSSDNPEEADFISNLTLQANELSYRGSNKPSRSCSICGGKRTVDVSSWDLTSGLCLSCMNLWSPSLYMVLILFTFHQIIFIHHSPCKEAGKITLILFFFLSLMHGFE